MASNNDTRKPRNHGFGRLGWLILLVAVIAVLTSCSDSSGETQANPTPDFSLQLHPTATDSGSSGTGEPADPAVQEPGYSGSNQTAPMPDQPLSESMLIGLWSKEPDKEATEYIEFYYGSNGQLRYYNYLLTTQTVGQQIAEYQVSYGDVSLMLNQGGCYCTADFSKDGTVTRAFYLDRMPDGVIIDQVKGTPYYQISTQPQTQIHEPDD